MMRLGLIAVTVLCFASMMQCYPSGFLRRTHVRGQGDGAVDKLAEVMGGFAYFSGLIGDIRKDFEDHDLEKLKADTDRLGDEIGFELLHYMDDIIEVPQDQLPFSNDRSMDECVESEHPWECFIQAATMLQAHSDLSGIKEGGMSKIELIRRLLSAQALMWDVGSFLERNGGELAAYEKKRSETLGKDSTIQALRDLLQKALYKKSQ